MFHQLFIDSVSNMFLLDKIYSSVYFIYRDRFKSDIPGIYAGLAIALMIFLHFLFVKKLLEIFNLLSFELNKLYIIIIFLILYGVIGLRYGYFFKVNEVKENQLIRFNYLLLYVFLFLLILICLLIFF